MQKGRLEQFDMVGFLVPNVLKISSYFYILLQFISLGQWINVTFKRYNCVNEYYIELFIIMIE